MATAKKKPTVGASGKLETRLTTSQQAISIHADGVWGGLTPKANIVMGFFTEKYSPPERVTYQLPDEMPGSLTELSRSGGGVFHREIQVEVYMSIDVARSLITWLQDKVATADAVDEAIAERRSIEGTDAAETLLVSRSIE